MQYKILIEEIEIPNGPTLENLIDRNVKSITSRVPVRKPYASELKLSDEERQEVLEAAQFISEREIRARGNRFVAKDNLNDPTLVEARKVVANFINIAQELYTSNVKESNHKYEEMDRLHADINTLLQGNKIVKAIEDLKKATKPVYDRIKAVHDTSMLRDHYEGNINTYFAMEAIHRLHNEE